MQQPYYDLPKGVTASNFAHLYRRVSDVRQLEGTGLGRQLDSTDSYIADLSLFAVKSYEDRGMSAFRGANQRHGELATILEAVKFGLIKSGEHLIIESLDRLSRQPPMDALEPLKEILRQGIIVHTVIDRKVFTYQGVNSDTSQLIGLLLSMARANEESRVKSVRVSGAWRDKREGNEILTAKTPGWLKVVRRNELTDPAEIAHAAKFDGDRAFTAIPERVKALKWMFEQAAAGMSTFSIARLLNDKGVEPWGKQRKGSTGKHRWMDRTVELILTTKTCLGEYRSNTVSFDENGKRHLTLAKVKPDYYLPAIDADLWMRANAALKKRVTNRQRGNTGEDFSNLLKGTTFCAHCGGIMHFKWTGRRPQYPNTKIYPFFRCTARQDGVCENSLCPKYGPVEKGILDFVQEIDLTDDRSAEVADIERRIAEATIKLQHLDEENRSIITTYQGTRTGVTMVKENEARMDAIEKELAMDRDRLLIARGAQTPSDRKAALKHLISRMGTANQQERFEIRAALNTKIREVIREIRFRKSGQIDVVLHNDKRYVWLPNNQVLPKMTREQFHNSVTVVPWKLWTVEMEETVA